MSTRDRALRNILLALIVRQTMEAILGRNESDELVVYAPSNEALLEEPDYPKFLGHINLNGAICAFQVWAEFDKDNTELQVFCRVRGNMNVYPLATGRLQDGDTIGIQFKVLQSREGFTETAAMGNYWANQTQTLGEIFNDHT